MTTIVYRPYPVIRTGTFLWIFIVLSVLAHLVFIMMGDSEQSAPKTSTVPPIQITLTEPAKSVTATEPLLPSELSPKLTPNLPTTEDLESDELQITESVFTDPTAESPFESERGLPEPVTTAAIPAPPISVAGGEPAGVETAPANADVAETNVATNSKGDAPSGIEIAAAALDWVRSQAMTQFEPELDLLNAMIADSGSRVGNGLVNVYRDPAGFVPAGLGSGDLVKLAFGLANGNILCAETRAANPLDSFDVGTWSLSTQTCALK